MHELGMSMLLVVSKTLYLALYLEIYYRKNNCFNYV